MTNYEEIPPENDGFDEQSATDLIELKQRIIALETLVTSLDERIAVIEEV